MPGRGRQRAGKADRVGISADPVEMVFAKPDHVGSELIGEPCFAQGLVDDDAVALGVAAVRKQEIAEFHAGLPPGLAGVTNAFPEAVSSCPFRITSLIAGRRRW